ncbi:helix-turn-helix domain-containing protein [Natronococcus jeotgali]|uniref:Bacterio-opsin activator HTH domain-containing protein n=1 Tax=Natronococcus jeotgali DSM 18795 TaxID=1227498 RepID=L9WQ06_9EURY|nr:bacterio-opsin activator domain-containing protein [Natronococcus jeotgali]ELY51565.1 bacterio-opsin activator HTH domain-containing protein [Natronococcus jeotgali DSM 18795]
MSLFGEFRIPAEAFALHETLRSLPELVVEVERVVAGDEVLTPYLWASGVDRRAFERAIGADPSIRSVEHIDDYERSMLYRGEWTENVDSLVYAYTELGATILEASAQRDEWELRMRFVDRDSLDEFQAYCSEFDVPYRLTQLFARAHSRGVGQYGLSEKQHEALLTAWEMGYFSSRSVSLADVAAELGITPQSLSERLQRGHRALIENTLAVTPPAQESSMAAE